MTHSFKFSAGISAEDYGKKACVRTVLPVYRANKGRTYTKRHTESMTRHPTLSVTLPSMKEYPGKHFGAMSNSAALSRCGSGLSPRYLVGFPKRKPQIQCERQGCFLSGAEREEIIEEIERVAKTCAGDLRSKFKT